MAADFSTPTVPIRLKALSLTNFISLLLIFSLASGAGLYVSTGEGTRDEVGCCSSAMALIFLVGVSEHLLRAKRKAIR